MATDTNTCQTCHRAYKRSDEHNRLYSKLVTLLANTPDENGELFIEEAWRVYFRRRFIGCEEIRLPSGEVDYRLKSSGELSVKEFNEFYMNVEVFCAERGVYLPDLMEAA